MAKGHRRRSGSSHSQGRRDERPPFFSVGPAVVPRREMTTTTTNNSNNTSSSAWSQSNHHQSDAKRGRVRARTRSRVSSYEDSESENDENKNVNSNTSSSNARRKGRKARCGTIDSTTSTKSVNLVSPPRIVRRSQDYVTLRDDVDSAKKGARSRWDMFDRRAYGDLASRQRTSGIGDVTSRSTPYYSLADDYEVPTPIPLPMLLSPRSTITSTVVRREEERCNMCAIC